MLKRPKQLRLDGDTVLLLSVLRSYLRLPYDSDVGTLAVRYFAEQVAVNLARQGQAGPLAALIPLMNQASRGEETADGAEAPDVYRYDPGSASILRSTDDQAWEPIPLAVPQR